MTEIVFILGAGASQEIGLPLGSGLRNSVASLLRIRQDDMGSLTDGDALILEALTRRVWITTREPYVELEALLHAARQISDAMPLASSIDSFIETRRGDARIELCGKLAIVRAILDAERSSGLYTDIRRPDIRPNQLELQGTWFNGFWQIFTEGCTVAELDRRVDAVKFINFNYDRCVERFIYFALQDYYALNPHDAGAIAQRLSVYHPYGSVGTLPWMNAPQAIEFGAAVHADNLLSAASSIKTFSEGTDETSSEIANIRRAINEAPRIVFLGFAFHRQNIRLLWPQARREGAGPNQRLFGTTLGISESDKQLITSELMRLTASQPWMVPSLNDFACRELFLQFRRSLSLV